MRNMKLALYSFVFGYVLGARYNQVPNETKFDYPLGMFLGLALFQFIGEILAQAPATIVTQPNFVKKVVFPLEVLPLSAALAALFHMLVSLLVLLVAMLVLSISVAMLR